MITLTASGPTLFWPQEDRKVWFTTVQQVGQIKSLITINDKLKKNAFLNTEHRGTEKNDFGKSGTFC